MTKHRIFTAIEASANVPRLVAPPAVNQAFSIGPHSAWHFYDHGRLPAGMGTPASPTVFFWDLEPARAHPFSEQKALDVMKRAREWFPDVKHFVYGQHHMAGWWAADMAGRPGFDARAARFRDLGDSGSRAFCQAIDANCVEIYPHSGVYQSLEELYRYAFRCTAYGLAASHGTPVVPTVSLRLVQHEIKPPDAGRFLTQQEWDAQIRGIIDAGGGIWIGEDFYPAVAWDWLAGDAAAMATSGDLLWQRYGSGVTTHDPAN